MTPKSAHPRTSRHPAGMSALTTGGAVALAPVVPLALTAHTRGTSTRPNYRPAPDRSALWLRNAAPEPGWRNLAIWALPPVAYALASDTLIGVVRAWALARHEHLTGEAATPLAILGGLLLWLLRLALAPASTLAGFRAWVLAECPVAPGRRRAPAPHPRKATKTARFLDLVTERHGPLASIQLNCILGI